MKNTKKQSSQAKNILHAFESRRLTQYSGLSPIYNYIINKEIISRFESFDSNKSHNASKYSESQILTTILLANLAGIYRMSNIDNFTHDPLVQELLDLNSNIDHNTLSRHLISLGEAGSHKLHEISLELANSFIKQSKKEHITLDIDSTVKGVYGKQEGSGVGYNHEKKGQRSYHPLLCFVSELKTIVNSWFRTGTAYTANGVCPFMNQTFAILPPTVHSVFVRGDSGFFSGDLFDLLEENQKQKTTYLIKVKFKGLDRRLQMLDYVRETDTMSQSSFSYQAKGWKKERQLQAVRILTGYRKATLFDTISYEVPEYEYFCFATNIKGLDGKRCLSLYKQRAESENWIEHTKNQLFAGKTLTHLFGANDILWQLSVLGYSISVMMRYEKDKLLWKTEPATFRGWFIVVPGIVTKTGGCVVLKMAKNYSKAEKWKEFEMKLREVA